MIPSETAVLAQRPPVTGQPKICKQIPDPPVPICSLMFFCSAPRHATAQLESPRRMPNVKAGCFKYPGSQTAPAR